MLNQAEELNWQDNKKDSSSVELYSLQIAQVTRVSHSPSVIPLPVETRIGFTIEETKRILVDLFNDEIRTFEEMLKEYFRSKFSKLSYVSSVYETYNSENNTFYLYTFTDYSDYEKETPIHDALSELERTQRDASFDCYVLELREKRVDEYIDPSKFNLLFERG